MIKLFEWIKNHKCKTLLLTSLLFILPVFTIHILFKVRTNIDILNAEWSAGEFLNYFGSFMSFIGTVSLGALALWQNHFFHQYHIESLEPMISMKLFTVDHFLYLSVKNTGQTEARDLSIKLNSIINNGDNQLFCDDLFTMTFDLFPNESVQGKVAIDGSNVEMQIFPKIDVTICKRRDIIDL